MHHHLTKTVIKSLKQTLWRQEQQPRIVVVLSNIWLTLELQRVSWQNYSHNKMIKRVRKYRWIQKITMNIQKSIKINSISRPPCSKVHNSCPKSSKVKLNWLKQAFLSFIQRKNLENSERSIVETCKVPSWPFAASASPYFFSWEFLCWSSLTSCTVSYFRRP